MTAATVKLAARVALNDAGEQLIVAIEGLDANDLEKALEAIDRMAMLLKRALDALRMLEDAAGEPS